MEWFQWLDLEYKGDRIIGATGGAFEQRSIDTRWSYGYWEAEQRFEFHGPHITIESWEYEDGYYDDGESYFGPYYARQGYSATGKITNVFINGVEVPRESVIANVPEPSTWALLIAGFGLVGVAARRRLETPA